MSSGITRNTVEEPNLSRMENLSQKGFCNFNKASRLLRVTGLEVPNQSTHTPRTT